MLRLPRWESMQVENESFHIYRRILEVCLGLMDLIYAFVLERSLLLVAYVATTRFMLR